ncbi:MAG: hypothetical protein IPI27_05665 [Betaproteobacteria bacterium]|nr:hypothetical protein [Betaproteobacteria bacterium]
MPFSRTVPGRRRGKATRRTACPASPRRSPSGERLFNDPRLSRPGTIACASCHLPPRSFTDGLPRAHGLAATDRNTSASPTSGGSAGHGWDGANDNLWAQSLRPLLDPRETGGDLAHVAAVVRADADLRERHRESFGAPPSAADEPVAVDVAKALAAYQETLATGRTPFDEFRDALARGDDCGAARYPRRHGAAWRSSSARAAATSVTWVPTSPTASSTTSASRSSPARSCRRRPPRRRPARAGEPGTTRWGRSTTIPRGRPPPRPATSRPSTATFGEFRVPSLRDVARTAPYMHNGSLAARDVVRHYSNWTRSGCTPTASRSCGRCG